MFTSLFKHQNAFFALVLTAVALSAASVRAEIEDEEAGESAYAAVCPARAHDEDETVSPDTDFKSADEERAAGYVVMSYLLNGDTGDGVDQEFIATYANHYVEYGQRSFGRLQEKMAERGIILSQHRSFGSALGTFFDLNGDGMVETREAKGAIRQVLPFGVTRGIILDFYSTFDNTPPESLEEVIDALEELVAEGFNTLAIMCGSGLLPQDFCNALICGNIDGRVVDTDFLYSCPMSI